MSVNDLLYPSSYVRAENKDIPAWYEFLLKDGLLHKHLSNEDPEPSACSLIKQFFDQANKPVNDQGQILPPQDNKRNKSLKVLALQTAALLSWNLDILEKELPIANRHQLLTELMKSCKVSFPIAASNDLGSVIEKLHDHSIMALVLYCCWGARTVVKSTFPCKPGGRITPTIPQSVPYQANAQQRCDEIRDQILNVLKEQLVDIVQYLEAVLHHVKRPVYLPNYDTFASPDSFKLNEDPAGIRISFEELHAQLCYDLGCMHFTHSFYEKAGEMFGHVLEWLRRLPDDRSGFCSIDKDRLNGYRTACLMVNGHTEDVDNDSLYLKVKHCMQVKGSTLRDLGEYIIDDIHKKELSSAFLDQIERELESGDAFGSDTVFDVKWSNAVRRAVRGLQQPTGLWTLDMNVAQLQRIVGFVQTVSARITSEEKKQLGAFLYSLANNLSDHTLREQLLNFEVIERLVDDSDMNDLRLRMKAPCLRPLVLENESPASPDGSSTTPTEEQITELEHDLIVTFDPVTIKDTLTKLHSITCGRKFYNLCSRWELSGYYISIISSSTVDALGFDLLSIVIAKAQLCYSDGDYGKAKSLISYVHNTCNANEEVKVKRLAANELLKAELLSLLSDSSLAYTDKEECGELRAQLSDVVTRCRYILGTFGDQSKLPSLPSRLIDYCAAMLLNLQDLTFFISMIRSSSSPPCMKFAFLLASVRAGLDDRPAEARKPASELWSASIAIFASMAASSTPSTGRGAQKKAQLEPIKNLSPPNAIISRPAFVEFVRLIKNPSMLQIVVSLLVHLHRLSRTDVLCDITCPGSEVIGDLWPTGMDGTPISGACVTVALREVLSYCLTLQPNHQGWIRTLADLHYAFNNYGAALQAYLLLGALATNYFSQLPPSGPFEDEQAIQRMVKCCMQMRCHTQAAVLCQLTKEIDYPTAFKALQENRERSDASELHYLDHVWDVQILEHAAYEHKESNEVAKLNAAISAASRPELNHSNAPQVGARVKASRMAKFFQAMARQYLC